jgi:transcriptional regulator with XRE-family HTH domain/quercetin dioxygenase-like cupin family protein
MSASRKQGSKPARKAPSVTGHSELGDELESHAAKPLDSSVSWVIAQRVREFRNQLGLTVEQLAERSGISKGMVSKVENAQASPSLGTLVKLAAAVSVPLTALFRGLEEEHDALVVRAGQGVEIAREGTRVGHHYRLLGDMRGPVKVLEPMLVTLNQHSEVFPLFQHPGIEFIYMLEGKVEYGHGSGRYVLNPGDAIQFSGEVVHGPTELCELPIRFLCVIAYGSPRR